MIGSMSLNDRAIALAKMTPHLMADVTLLSTSEGGKTKTALPGWGCPCMIDLVEKIAYDAHPTLDSPFAPGESRRVGMVFLMGEEAARLMRNARRSYLWEGKVIGTAVVVDDQTMHEVFEA